MAAVLLAAKVLLAAVASFDGCPAPFHGEVPIGESSMAHLQRWGKSTLAQVLANPPVPSKSRTADRHINLQTVELDAVAQRGAWANAHIGDLTASPVLYIFSGLDLVNALGLFPRTRGREVAPALPRSPPADAQAPPSPP